MPWVGLEPTIPAFERAKTVHALDRVPLWSVHEINTSGNVCSNGTYIFQNAFFTLLHIQYNLGNPTYMGPRYRPITENDGLMENVGTNLLSCTAQHRSFRIDYHLTEFINIYLFYIHKCVQWIPDLHTLQFTVTHALGYSLFTSRILATDL
jgi:hypothetical protein